jgi:hypothetical protein
MATKGIPMLLMLLVTVALVAAYVWIFMRRFKESSEAPPAASRSRPGAGRTARSVPAVTQSESLEGVLLARLGAGEITRAQYLREMERIAARDADRHPFVVPPDVAPPDASAEA